MKADLEFVSRASTFQQMKIRLEECKMELRQMMPEEPSQEFLEIAEALTELIKNILGVKEILGE